MHFMPHELHTFTRDLIVCIAPTLGILIPCSTSLQVNEWQRSVDLTRNFAPICTRTLQLNFHLNLHYRTCLRFCSM